MEETELEEGEAFSYNINNNDYDATTDPENALSSLSYMDEKIQNVLGHFQKDFEGGVFAENLGAKFGGYGSFLPTYPRSPGSSYPKNQTKVRSCNVPRSPNNTPLEDGCYNSACWVSGSQSLRTGPPINFGTLPALKATSANDSIKQEVSITSTHNDELASRCDFANKKTLKVRIKVGSDNLSTQKNAAIYSGLGLNISPSSSLDESPSESEGVYRETQELLLESPTSILRVMTSFPVPGEALLSPLPEHLLNLTVKKNFPKENRSDSGKGDGILSGDKKAKPVEKKDFPVEMKSGNDREIRNKNGIVSKEEVDINTLACDSKTLKLPLLSNSCSAVDKVKNKRIARNKGAYDAAMEESVELILTQEIDWENAKAGSARKYFEEKKTIILDDILGYTRNDGYNRAEKTYDYLKADSNTLKGSKSLNSEPVDPPEQKISKKATSHEQDNMNLLPAKEHISSGGKRKSKGSQGHGCLAANAPKESLRVGSLSMMKNKQTAHVNNYINKRESGDQKLERPFQKAEDRYRDFFGDIGELEREENQTRSFEIHSGDWLKEADKIEKNISAINCARNDRLSGKRTEDLLANKLYPEATMDGASNSANVNVAGTSVATAAPVLIKENWVCCDKCQKWRLLPISINPADLPEKWLCSMLNWLPTMNRCIVDEEETTKAVFALYQVPAVESQTNLQSNSGSVMPRLPTADALQPDLNRKSFGSHAMPTAGRKKLVLKEISHSMDKDGPAPTKKNVQSSLRSGSLTDVTQSPVVSEPGLWHLSRCDLPVEKHQKKQKEKHKVSDYSSDGGDAKTSKMKGKRITDQDSLRTSKKIKAESLHLSNEDLMFEHAGKGGSSTSNGLSTASVGKDQPKHSERSSYKDSMLDKKERLQVSGKKPKTEVQVSLTDGSRDLANFDGGGVAKKRKNDQLYTGFLQSMDNHLQDGRVLVKEKFSKNDCRREKKARVSKSGGKDSSATKSSCKLEKKSRHTKNHQSGQDQGSTLSQQRLDGMDSLKRDFGSAQPSLAVTSSSSKVSGSHKSKLGILETNGSPVESVSSSPMRNADLDKLTSTRRNVAGKDESHDAGLFVAGSPRRCADGEDNDGSDRSRTVKKEKTFVTAQHGSLESSVLDVQDKDVSQLGGSNAKVLIESSPDIRKGHFRDVSVDYLGQEAQYAGKSATMDEHCDEENQNDNYGKANFSRPRKSGKGSSWSKDRNRNFKSDSVDEQQDHAPLYEVKPRGGRNKFQERLGAKSDENENRFADNKKSVGKFSGESSKRENQSTCSDAKPDATGGQDVMSSAKQNIVQDSDGEEYTKKFHSHKSDNAEIASGRGNSISLPPSGGTQNEMLTRFPYLVSGSQKGNGSCGSQGDYALRVQKQIKKADYQNGTQQSSSRHTTSGGCRIEDVDAPSPMRKDSSNQAASNALKEAKDLKHLADRLKNSGSNVESTALYFQAALKFLHSASLLESCKSESAKHGEMIQSVQMYSSTAKLCEFCAHEYERLKDMAAASLAYKCMEVAYMRVIYSSHANASRDRHELQTALQMVPPGESPSSSASEVDNLNHPTTAEKVVFPKGVCSPQVAGNHVISAQNRPNFVRLLNFAQDVNYAMEASKKSRNAFKVTNITSGGAESGTAVFSVHTLWSMKQRTIVGSLRSAAVVPAMEYTYD